MYELHFRSALNWRVTRVFGSMYKGSTGQRTVRGLQTGDSQAVHPSRHNFEEKCWMSTAYTRQRGYNGRSVRSREVGVTPGRLVLPGIDLGPTHDVGYTGATLHTKWHVFLCDLRNSMGRVAVHQPHRIWYFLKIHAPRSPATDKSPYEQRMVR